MAASRQVVHWFASSLLLAIVSKDCHFRAFDAPVGAHGCRAVVLRVTMTIFAGTLFCTASLFSNECVCLDCFFWCC